MSIYHNEDKLSENRKWSIELTEFLLNEIKEVNERITIEANEKLIKDKENVEKWKKIFKY